MKLDIGSLIAPALRGVGGNGAGRSTPSDQPAPPPNNQNQPPLWWEGVLLFIAALLAAGGFAYLADFARRALVNGPDTLGVLSIAIPALVAGTLSTQVQPLLTRLAVGKPSAAVVRGLIAAVILFVGFLLDTAGAQWVATFYEGQAINAFNHAQYTNALGFYQKAVDLDGNQYTYHFGLGLASDRLLDSGKALTEYQAAHNLDPNQPWPLLDLTEIYLRRSSSDNVSALAQVNLVTQANLDEWATYVFHRDRGWAYVQLGYLSLAETELQAALNLRPDVPGANCLMGMLKEAQQDRPGAREWWTKCAANYIPINSEEHEYLDPRWPPMAATRMLDSRGR